jgi:hypothetical protein
MAVEEKKDETGDILPSSVPGGNANNNLLILKHHLESHPETLLSITANASEIRQRSTAFNDDEPVATESSSSSQEQVPLPATATPSSSATTATSKATTAISLPPPRRWVHAAKWATHLVLMMAFAALATSYGLRSVHRDYFVPMVERALRTDEHLMEEFTYYARQCTAQDITVQFDEDMKELIIGSSSSINNTNNDATSSSALSSSPLERIMKHGALVFPQLLQPDTITHLRQFVVDKNAAVRGTEAEYPVSQGYNRISYGIEGGEDPAVVRALKEIHDHAELKQLLQGLVGRDPAVTEVTAITASYGCPHQVWHADVKQDGNALQWSRTYSHSYSLFIPLQDTTSEMGPTDLCPGTHYCADALYQLCEESKIGLNEIVPENDGIWKAGDAALLNQQVWHRGTEHNSPDAPDRIVFIVSFIGRPNDTRQLSRGTYFHQKWNMW